MRELAQVIDKDVVAGIGKKLFKVVAVGTAIFAGLAGVAVWLLMQLPTC